MNNSKIHNILGWVYGKYISTVNEHKDKHLNPWDRNLFTSIIEDSHAYLGDNLVKDHSEIWWLMDRGFIVPKQEENPLYFRITPKGIEYWELYLERFSETGEI